MKNTWKRCLVWKFLKKEAFHRGLIKKLSILFAVWTWNLQHICIFSDEEFQSAFFIYKDFLQKSDWTGEFLWYHFGIPYRWKVRRGYVLSVKIFRRLKVSSNRKKFVTFHRRKHLTNFEISNFSKNIISEKRYRYIFLIFYSNVHVNIYNSLLVIRLETVPLGSHYVRF